MITNNKEYFIRDNAPAPAKNDRIDRVPYLSGKLDISSEDGWENRGMPIGNGYLGAVVFGRTDTERIQITENSFCNPLYEPTCGAGLNNFAELWLDFGHKDITDYKRSLSLNNAIVGVEYCCGSVRYKREYFASYPAKLIAVKITADTPGALSLRLRAEVPFVRDWCVEPGDGMGKSGSVSYAENTVILNTVLNYDFPQVGMRHGHHRRVGSTMCIEWVGRDVRDAAERPLRCLRKRTSRCCAPSPIS